MTFKVNSAKSNLVIRLAMIPAIVCLCLVFSMTDLWLLLCHLCKE